MPTNGATLEKEAEQDELSEDVFASIPDVDAPSKKRGAVDDARALVTRVRQDLESAFKAEMDRLENGFVARIGAMQTRIEMADAELARLAAERQRLVDAQEAHERRLKAIRELAERG